MMNESIAFALFWSAFLFVSYTFVLYPVMIFVVAQFINRQERAADSSEPVPGAESISIIVAARNEEENIYDKVIDLANQNFDSEQIEIIVVSDGSEDDTVLEIERAQSVLNAADTAIHVCLINKPNAEGKAAALNDAVARSTGTILIMTDARQRFGADKDDRDAVRQLASVFADPAIGCVSGELYLVDEQSHALQKDLGLYWRIEKWIRRNEARIDSVPGVTGAIYAIRRELFSPIPPQTLLDDVLIPLRVILAGYRVTFNERAVARDTAPSEVKKEWRRKVRTLAGNWQLLNLVPAAFIPIRNRIWLQFYSHKIFRLLAPFALIIMLISSGMVSGILYRSFFLVQGVAYLAAAVAALVPDVRRYRILGAIHTFVLLNLAAIAGFLYWITRRSHRAWVK